MSDIETLLKELDLEFLHGVPVHLTDEMVAQIKQEFINAGWNPGTLSLTNDEIERLAKAKGVHAKSLLTGQEWYEEFSKEVGLFTPELARTFVNNPTKLYDYLRKAAKKAAGLGS